MSFASLQSLMKNHTKGQLFLPLALVLLGLALFGALRLVVAEGDPRVSTDKADYLSNETVTVTGSGFDPGTSYDVPVIRPDGSIVKGDGSFIPGWDTVLSDESGAFTYLYKLNGIEGIYQVMVHPSPWSGDLAEPPLASTTFTDANPAGNLDQCRNGPYDAPVSCTGSAWANGNANATQAHYLEGDSLPYRLRFENLATGSVIHTVTIEWDTTKSGKHAIDYVTSFDRTETDADPCSGVAGCSLSGPKSTFPIPLDPNVAAAGVTQIPGVFTLFNGNITSVSAYTLDGSYTGDSSTSITISFTADVSNPVLAWGGHIATRGDWGIGESAIAIPGSPYHTRFIDLDGKGGNQDRSLSSEAVIFPASITIIKDAVPDSPDDFSFTTSGDGLSNFQLDDDTDPTLSDTIVFGGLTTFGSANTRTVTEADPAPAFLLTDLTCEEDPGGLPQDDNSTTDLATRTATIILEEGEIVTCTFTDTRQPATLCLEKTVITDDGGTAVADDFQAYIDGNPVTWDCHEVGPGSHTASEDVVPGYTPSDWGGDCAAGGSVSVGAGETKTCTISNDDIAPTLCLEKTVITDDGGTAVADDFQAYIDSTAVAWDCHQVMVGSYTVSEDVVPGYTPSDWGTDCTAAGAVTLSEGQTKTCTISNDDIAPTLCLEKTVITDDGGTAVADDFQAYIDSTPVAWGCHEVDAGSYTVSEDEVFGYTASDWNTDCAADGSVSLAEGETKTCDITNDDIAPTLCLVKTVITDDGGDAVASDFQAYIDSTAVAWGCHEVDAGSYTVSEDEVFGYTASDWNTDCAADGSVSLAEGETKTCDITNDDIAPTLTVNKVLVPPDDTGLFNLQIDGVTYAANVGDGGTTGAIAVSAGSHTVGETAGTNTDLDDYITVIGGDCAPDGSITLALDEDATCTITNTEKGRAKVIKTVQGVPPTGDQSFEFQLRQGASETSEGTLLETLFANAANGGVIEFASKLVPSTTYQLCERVMPGWMTSLSSDLTPTPFVLYNPGGDNSVLCVDFTVEPGETKTFAVDNTPPPGGLGRTIGFWKNWTSCDGHGNQDHVLDETLASFPGGGVWIGDIFVDTCEEAVAILNKSKVSGNEKKMANDAAYGLAAQLLAAELNIQAGAASCPAAETAIDNAQKLLSGQDPYSSPAIHFTATGSYLGPKSKGALKELRQEALDLAATLDDYNNNTLCP